MDPILEEVDNLCELYNVPTLCNGAGAGARSHTVVCAGILLLF